MLYIYVCANDIYSVCIYTGRRLWVFPRFAGDCANNNKKSPPTGTTSEKKCEINDSCSQLILRLHDVYDAKKVSRGLYIGKSLAY